MPTAEQKKKELFERKQAMIRLGFTDAEIADVLECDERIDKGEKLFSLSAEQEKASKDLRSTSTKNYTFEKKTKKVNNEKLQIIDSLRKAVKEFGGTGIEVTNAEREFTFNCNGTKYKITLACPRT